MSNIRTLRKSQKKTLMALAHDTGSTPAWLTYIERYGHIPGSDLRQRIAEALGVEEDDLWPELNADDSIDLVGPENA